MGSQEVSQVPQVPAIRQPGVKEGSREVGPVQRRRDGDAAPEGALHNRVIGALGLLEQRHSAFSC